MTTEFQTGPLYDLRALLATEIRDSIGADVTVYDNWTANFTSPAVILDGGGWDPYTGCSMQYKLRINCIVSDQSGLAPQQTEELTRQVWDIVSQTNLRSESVPAPGTMKIGDRDYPCCQFTVPMRLDPTE